MAKAPPTLTGPRGNCRLCGRPLCRAGLRNRWEVCAVCWRRYRCRVCEELVVRASRDSWCPTCRTSYRLACAVLESTTHRLPHPPPWVAVNEAKYRQRVQAGLPLFEE